jgi:hypothetical protein
VLLIPQEDQVAMEVEVATAVAQVLLVARGVPLEEGVGLEVQPLLKVGLAVFWEAAVAQVIMVPAHKVGLAVLAAAVAVVLQAPAVLVAAQ